MATTQSQSKAPASAVNIAHGSYIIESGDTAAAITITCGFKPRYVKVVNTNASGDVMMEWFEGMTAAYGILTGIDGARSLVTSLGITVSASGFIIGLNTDLNVKAEQLHWQAIG
jgi:hypothetical protein